MKANLMRPIIHWLIGMIINFSQGKTSIPRPWGRRCKITSIFKSRCTTRSKNDSNCAGETRGAIHLEDRERPREMRAAFDAPQKRRRARTTRLRIARTAAAKQSIPPSCVLAKRAASQSRIGQGDSELSEGERI